MLLRVKLLNQTLRRLSSPGLEEKFAKLVPLNGWETNEYQGMICVMVGDVIGDRVGLQQFLTLIKVRFNHQGVFFLMNAGQEFFLDFEGAGAV